MLREIMEELRVLLELEVRPPSAGVKPGLAPGKKASAGVHNTMVHTAHTLGLSSEKRQALIMQNAQKTAQRAQQAADKTRRERLKAAAKKP